MKRNTTTTTTTAVTRARTRSPKRTTTTATVPATVPTVVKTWDDVLAVARTVTPDTFGTVLADVNRDHGVTHAARNVSRFDGRRVMAVQNDTIRRNADARLSDTAILFTWACAFPMAAGRVFDVNRATTPDAMRAAINTGTAIVNGVRAEYNRNGHGDPAWTATTPKSERYGDRRPVFTAAPTATA